MNEKIINNAELVKMFGTQKNKDYYAKYKKVATALKNNLLKRAVLFCDIEDLGKGKYKIRKKQNKIIPNFDEFSVMLSQNRYERAEYGVEFDKKMGVYSIEFENKIYIGSTIKGFRARHNQYVRNDKIGVIRCKGDGLYQKGGIIKILWSTDIRCEETIRNKEIEYIRHYKTLENYEVVNDEKWVTGGTARKVRKKHVSINRFIKVSKSDYEKAVNLLKNNGINIIFK